MQSVFITALQCTGFGTNNRYTAALSSFGLINKLGWRLLQSQHPDAVMCVKGDRSSLRLSPDDALELANRKRYHDEVAADKAAHGDSWMPTKDMFGCDPALARILIEFAPACTFANKIGINGIPAFYVERPNMAASFEVYKKWIFELNSKQQQQQSTAKLQFLEELQLMLSPEQSVTELPLPSSAVAPRLRKLCVDQMIIPLTEPFLQHVGSNFAELVNLEFTAHTLRDYNNRTSQPQTKITNRDLTALAKGCTKLQALTIWRLNDGGQYEAPNEQSFLDYLAPHNTLQRLRLTALRSSPLLNPNGCRRHPLARFIARAASSLRVLDVHLLHVSADEAPADGKSLTLADVLFSSEATTANGNTSVSRLETLDLTCYSSESGSESFAFLRHAFPNLTTLLVPSAQLPGADRSLFSQLGPLPLRRLEIDKSIRIESPSASFAFLQILSKLEDLTLSTSAVNAITQYITASTMPNLQVLEILGLENCEQRRTGVPIRMLNDWQPPPLLRSLRIELGALSNMMDSTGFLRHLRFLEELRLSWDEQIYDRRTSFKKQKPYLARLFSHITASGCLQQHLQNLELTDIVIDGTIRTLFAALRDASSLRRLCLGSMNDDDFIFLFSGASPAAKSIEQLEFSDFNYTKVTAMSALLLALNCPRLVSLACDMDPDWILSRSSFTDAVKHKMHPLVRIGQGKCVFEACVDNSGDDDQDEMEEGEWYDEECYDEDSDDG